jgi:methylated-DNA-[protein]-cysteine S-methyltransferase
MTSIRAAMSAAPAHVTHDSPLGPLHLLAEGGLLVGVYFAMHRGLALAAPATPARAPLDQAVLDRARQELDAYFERAPGAFAGFTVPLGARGTAFQRRVWSALTAIARGTTLGYAALAARIGAPRAVRAVGAASAANPLSIVVPCHRVIGRDGSLTGYAGGLQAKRWLLDHEGAWLDSGGFAAAPR